MSKWPKNRVLFCLLWWPFDGRNCYCPWWLIGWRLLLYPPMQVFRCAYTAIVFCGWGASAARHVFNDMR